MKPLSELEKGEFGYIVDMRKNELILQLFELGCYPGDLIKVEENSPKKKFMTFSRGKSCYHLFRDMAKEVITNQVNYHFCLN